MTDAAVSAPSTVRSAIVKRLAAMESDRSSFMSQWYDLGQYLLPRRGRFLNTYGDRHRGTKRNQKVINGIGLRAGRTLASGMMSGITSPARAWFKLSVADPALADFAPVKRWLDDVAQRMRDVLARSNFYTAMQPTYRELGVFATAPLAMLEDPTDIVRFYPQTCGSYALSHDDRLMIDGFGRRFELSVGQLVKMYDRKLLSRTVREFESSNKLDALIPMAQLIQPNSEYLPGWKGRRGMPFRSMIVEAGGPDEAQPLEDKGFHEFPILCGRWETMPETPYGTSCPGMDALGDIRQVQFTAQRKAELLDKGNTPPLQAPSALQNRSIGLFPGNITYRPPVQGQDAKVEPIYEPDPRWYDFTRQDLKELEQDVDEAFFVDLFRMMQQLDGVQPRNQLELTERREEKLLQLGPVLEQLNGDVFDQLVDRLFAMMWRRGLIPPPPPVLEGWPLKVEYTSVMAQAQRAIATGSIERFAMFGGNLAKLAGPKVLDKFDFDQMVDDYGEAIGVPSRLIVSDEDVAEARQQRAQQEQMMQAAAMGPALKQGIDALAKGATTVPAEGNVLSKLTG